MKAKPITIFISGFILGVLFLVGALVAWQLAPNWQTGSGTEVTIDNAFNKINNGEIKELVQHPSQFDLTDKKDNEFYAKISAENDTFKNVILTKAIEKGVSVKSQEGTSGFFWTFVIGFLPVLFFTVFSILVFILLLQLIIKNFRTMK